MEIAIIALLVILIGLVVYMLVKPKKETTNDSAQLLLQQLNELSRTVDSKIGDFSKTVDNKLGDSAKQTFAAMKEIAVEVTNLRKTNEQVVSFADQLQDLQNILKNPKERGTILGEYYLETILKRVLPPGTYQTQYKFKNGEAVDAVVFVGEHIVPIDSKFSLENYNKIIEASPSGDVDKFIRSFKSDIKNRIDETSKYIRPEENTLEFAFMFVPHESIYYDLLVAEVGAIKINTQDLIEYAFKKKVIIVSPTSFLAYLQTVLQGLKTLKIEKSVQEIQKHVTNLSKHLKDYDIYHDKLGNSLKTTVNHWNQSSKEFKKIDKDILRITGESIDIEHDILDRPQLDQ